MLYCAACPCNQHVPFRLLGKHCAYRVGLSRADFREWDVLLARSASGGAGRGAQSRKGVSARMAVDATKSAAREMTEQAKGNLDIFRQGGRTRVVCERSARLAARCCGGRRGFVAFCVPPCSRALLGMWLFTGGSQSATCPRQPHVQWQPHAQWQPLARGIATVGCRQPGAVLQAVPGAAVQGLLFAAALIQS